MSICSQLNVNCSIRAFVFFRQSNDNIGGRERNPFPVKLCALLPLMDLTAGFFFLGGGGF